MKKTFFGIIATVLVSVTTFASRMYEINRNIELNNVSTFLNTYYLDGHNLGKSIITKVDNQEVIVSEVLNTESNLLNGYIVVDKNNNELLYFMDYKRDTKEINAIDFKNNVTDLINLKKDDKFETFAKIDLIKEIEKANYDPASVQKFWGKSCGPVFELESGANYRTCCHYVMWINTGCDQEGVN